MEHEHTREGHPSEARRRARRRLSPGLDLLGLVYGGIDGTMTTFAIIAGVVGVHLPLRVILILGGASLVADGFAMVGGQLSGATRSEHEEFHQAEAIERLHIEVAPDGEREEVSEILRGLGIIGNLLDREDTATRLTRGTVARAPLSEPPRLCCAQAVAGPTLERSPRGNPWPAPLRFPPISP